MLCMGNSAIWMSGDMMELIIEVVEMWFLIRMLRI